MLKRLLSRSRNHLTLPRAAALGVAAAAGLAGSLRPVDHGAAAVRVELSPARASALAPWAAEPAPPPGAATAPAAADSGFVIRSDVVTRSCSGCHLPDSSGRLGRLSYIRKTPEGWQTSIRRMVSLYGLRLDPETAREVVRYLSNHQGLAPEEFRPGRFESEQRMIEYSYADKETERTCNACHSMGRVVTQRRTAEEWELLTTTHRALYPLIDSQRFRRSGPPPADATGPAADRRHPVDRAVEHLARAFPLETAEWAAWSANLRAPRLEGSWSLSGHDPARGPMVGTVTIRPVPGSEDEFTTETSYFFPEDGTRVRRTGRSIVYTGYQWRGRSTAQGGDEERREVMMVERGWGEMSGRWYTGEYAELGMDVTLRRLAREPVIAAAYPRALRSGAAGQELRVYGANLPAGLSARDVDLGPGVTVRGVSRAGAEEVVLRVDVAPGAAVGARDLFVGGVSLPKAVAVYDRMDALRVLPRVGMARVGGTQIPKQLQQFEAVAYHNGPDGKPETADDLELGRVPAAWGLEEYPETYEDDDLRFVGSIDQKGLFTPAVDGPNAERSGNRNNIGTVWVTASYTPPGAPAGAAPLRARAHLLVTVPLYMFWDPWQVTTD